MYKGCDVQRKISKEEANLFSRGHQEQENVLNYELGLPDLLGDGEESEIEIEIRFEQQDHHHLLEDLLECVHFDCLHFRFSKIISEIEKKFYLKRFYSQFGTIIIIVLKHVKSLVHSFLIGEFDNATYFVR